MNTDSVFYADANELARLVRTKVLSPIEVVQAHLDRIEDVNPRVNAVVTLLAEDALKAAKKSEKAVLNGDSLGVFHGVPFSIKDSIDYAGVPTQAGSRLFAQNIPSTDACAVIRMKAVGAIPLMKTNAPEFSAWWETDNLVTGRTNNPWSLNRTPGGSSGGESAAIAAGMSPIGLGSDVAISVRGPAALTGIVGLKATHGYIPYTGHYPRWLARYWHIGPMARSVRDIATAFSVLNGSDGIDGYAIHDQSATLISGALAGKPIRVGWMADEGFGRVEHEIVAAVEAAAFLLKDLGCEVEQIRLPILEHNDFSEIAMAVFIPEMLPKLRALTEGRESDLHSIGKMYAGWPDVPLMEFIEAQAKIEQLKSVIAGYFQHYDVLLCPVLPMMAQLHGQTEYEVNGHKVPAAQILRGTVPFNLSGNPALSLPFCFSSDNLPISIQLVAKWADEAMILHLGALIEAVVGVRNRHPSL